MAAAGWAGAIWGAFNAHIANRTQWEHLNTQVKEINRQIEQVKTIGATELRLFAQQSQYRMGAIESSWGHSGISADSGSAFDTILTQAGVNGLNKLNMQRNTELQVRNLTVSRQFLDYQRKTLDKQIWIQVVNGALAGAGGSFPSGTESNTDKQKSMSYGGGSTNESASNNYNNFGAGFTK